MSIFDTQISAITFMATRLLGSLAFLMFQAGRLGVVLCLVIIIQNIDGGVATVVFMGTAKGKFHVANLTWDFTSVALWVVIVGRGMEQFIFYGSNQTVVQRYLVTPDLKSAQRAIWTKGALTLVTSFLFFGLGTSLWPFTKRIRNCSTSRAAPTITCWLFSAQQELRPPFFAT